MSPAKGPQPPVMSFGLSYRVQMRTFSDACNAICLHAAPPRSVLACCFNSPSNPFLELGRFVITHNIYNVGPIHELLAFDKNYCPAPSNSKTTPQPNCPPPLAVL
jgi:hypothetical protein